MKIVRRPRYNAEVHAVPDDLLGPGRTVPVGKERLEALIDWLDANRLAYYGDPIPGRIDALALYVAVPGLTWEEAVARYTAKEVAP